MRLIEMAHMANLDLTVKIGGCEAIRDLLKAKQIGVRYIVAPMVESPYASCKYDAAKNQVYSYQNIQGHTLRLFPSICNEYDYVHVSPIEHSDRARVDHQQTRGRWNY